MSKQTLSIAVGVNDRGTSCPRNVGIAYPRITPPDELVRLPAGIQAPAPRNEAVKAQLAYGPNITALSPITPLPD